MAEEPKTAEAATVETDLLGNPILPEAPVGLSLEERLAALEALTQKLLDYGAALQVDETQARLADLEAKTESPFDPAELEGRLYELEGRYAALEAKVARIAEAQPRPAYPKTIDELPSPFASEG